MRGDRATGVGLLALLYAVSGVLCVVGALWPASPRTPVALAGGLAVIGLGAAAVLWLLRSQLPDPVVHLALTVVSALIGLLAWQSATAVGVVGLGPALVAVGVFAGHFLSPRAARLHLVLLLVLSTAGAVAAAPTGFVSPWITTVVTVVVLTEAQSRISAQLRRAAGTDPLTGLANRRLWEAEAARSLAHATRTGEALTVAVLDLDHFKVINDEDGHGAGDALLRSLARQWSAELRQADLLGRYGGDEFVLCLPSTDIDAAGELLSRLRNSHPASWSVGTATSRPGDSLADLLARADAELYRRKRSRTP